MLIEVFYIDVYQNGFKVANVDHGMTYPSAGEIIDALKEHKGTAAQVVKMHRMAE